MSSVFRVAMTGGGQIHRFGWRLLTLLAISLSVAACEGTPGAATTSADAAVQDTAQQDTAQQDTAQQDTAQQDTAQQDTAQLDATAADAAVDTGGGGATSTKLMFVLSKETKMGQTKESYESSAFNAISVDAAGNTWIAGTFEGVLDLGSGAVTAKSGQGLFVAKLLPTGQAAWVKAYGSIGADKLFALAVRPDGKAVFAGAGQDIDLGAGVIPGNFIAMLDDAGNLVWAKSTTTAASVEHIQVTKDGSFVTTGRLTSAVDLGGGKLPFKGINDTFVARFDASGKHVWSQSFGNADDSDEIRDFGLTGNDEIVMTGVLGPDGAKFGDVLINGKNEVQFLAKLDAQGKPMWARKLPDHTDTRVAVQADGTFFVSGGATAGIDFGNGVVAKSNKFIKLFVAKFDAGGQAVAASGFGSKDQYGVLKSTALASCGGGLVSVGLSQGPLALGGSEPSGAFVVRLDLDLKPGAAMAFGSEQGTFGIGAFACNATGQSAFAGGWVSSVKVPAKLTFGNVTLTLAPRTVNGAQMPGMATLVAAFAP